MSFENFVDEVWSDASISNLAIRRANKQLSQILLELNHTPVNVLNLGTENAASLSLKQNGVLVDADSHNNGTYDTILALDEFFTYSENEAEQKQLIEDSVKLLNPGGILLASIRDYRNNPIHKRNLGDSSYININNVHYVVVEINTPDDYNNQMWQQTNFIIESNDKATAYELGNRRTLYFKQLAKYCNDAGCKQFGVLKEQFWKSPWRRSMEHIAWSRF
jgi:hypothetical protein